MNTSYIPYRRLFYCLLAKIHQGRWRTEIGYCAHSPEIRSLCLIKWPNEMIQILSYFYDMKIIKVFILFECPSIAQNEKKNLHRFSYFKNMANYETFCLVISSSINYLFLKSELLFLEKGCRTFKVTSE